MLTFISIIASLVVSALPLVQDPRPQTQTRGERQGPKPYAEVITDKAVTEEEVFKVHRIEDKLFFELPASELGKEFLWTTEIAKTPPGGYGGTSVGDRVVRWTKRGDKVLLRTVSYAIRAEEGEAIRVAVDLANVDPIVMAFDVQAYGPKDTPVIDVTRLYTSDPAEFSVRRALGVGNVDSGRSFFERAKAFPTNIEVQSLLTFGEGAAAPGGPFGQRQSGGASNTALVNYSLVKLPEKPMMGRLFDSRVGFFTERFLDFGTAEHRAAPRQFITRYRLEKKDPAAAMSEPVKPIIYYLSREVPEKWRPYIKKGIEDWQPAFEQAGFKRAIIAKDAPTYAEDPDWSAEDARYSVIRWAPTTTENAMGPHVHDPRSGEIVSAHIIIWHNILNLLTKWYFTQASPNDVRAQKLPFPDDLMGELVRYVTAHEVGHTLGLQHNMKASSSYSVQQLRNPGFTKAYGTEASIMDYGRFNYVAQPGDGARLIPLVGPYDRFAIEWGYKPIAGVRNPADEKRELDRLAAKQVTDPMLRFGGNPNEDPSQQSEDLGSDPVEATRLGLKNLERVAAYLLAATTKPGEDYADLSSMYGDVWGQWNQELMHVTTVVGGVVMTNYHAGRGGDVFVPVPRERQRAAVALLVERGFHPPKALLRPEVLNRIQPAGASSRVLGGQQMVLGRLLNDSRLTRMLELQAANGSKGYTAEELLQDLRDGIWSELDSPNPKIDLYRRNLQRAYVLVLGTKVQNTSSDIRSLAIGELRAVVQSVRKGIPVAGDRATALHLDDMRRLIEETLKPK